MTFLIVDIEGAEADCCIRVVLDKSGVRFEDKHW